MVPLDVKPLIKPSSSILGDIGKVAELSGILDLPDQRRSSVCCVMECYIL
jgi:hypothetical protein